MRTKKSILVFVVLTFQLILIMASTQVSASPAVTVTMDVPNGYYPELPVTDPPNDFIVEFLIDASELTYNGADGIVFWAMDVKVNPSVLEPDFVSFSGDLLGDFADEEMYPGPHPVQVKHTDTGIVEVSNMWFATDLEEMSGGAATTDDMGPLPTPYRLVRIRYNVVGTGSSLINITKCEYTNFANPATKITMAHEDAWYGVPIVPEFPLGIEILMLLAPLIPLIYLLRRKEWKK